MFEEFRRDGRRVNEGNGEATWVAEIHGRNVRERGAGD